MTKYDDETHQALIRILRRAARRGREIRERRARDGELETDNL